MTTDRIDAERRLARAAFAFDDTATDLDTAPGTIIPADSAVREPALHTRGDRL